MTVAYYDTLTQAQADTSLSSYSDIFTFGLKVKNDGGGAHYKKYATATRTPFLAFQSAGSSPSFWGLVPDNSTVNPLQSEKPTDKERIQECIDFIRWWNETTTGTPTIGVITDYSSSRNAVKLIIPANRTFLVDTHAIGSADPLGLRISGPITIEGEDRQTSVIKLVEASVGSEVPIEDEPNSGASDTYDDLFLVQGDPVSMEDTTPQWIDGVTFRNFTMQGSYEGKVPDHGKVHLLSVTNVRADRRSRRADPPRGLAPAGVG